MLFSIVTPSFNCGDCILENFRSVREQGFPPDQLEHWVIDGGSTDSTVELLKQQADIKWVSERDRGLSDAVNKGIQRAQGDWIIWLNADDFLAPDALRVFLEQVRKHPQTRIFCGQLTILRYDGSVEQTVPAWDYNLKDLLGTRTGINQSATFIHREAYAKVGLLDVSDRYTMDYEWLVRAMHHYECAPIPHVLTFYRRRRGSITDANLVRQFENFLAIRRRYGQPRLCRAEFRIRFYLYTDWLRRVRWFRRSVRRIERLLGKEPLHPA
jgi:glycosyltransferase involved in cell wall biosynthesis